jgi:2,5-diketo-D-gluconate reductase A
LGITDRPCARCHASTTCAALDLTLDDDDIAAIDALDREDGRLGPDPREM